MKRLGGILAAWLIVSSAGAAASLDRHQVTSPDKRLRVVVTTDGEGHLAYSVWRDTEKGGHQPIVEDSRLGFILADMPKLDRGFVLSKRGRRSIDETWELPWGERRYVRNHFNE